MADKEFTLRIITPERVFYEGIVDMVEFNTTEGQIGVLPGHIPLTVIVKPGILHITEKDGEKEAALHSGFAEILPEGVTIEPGEVPLAPLPKTGQNPMAQWVCLMSGLMLGLYGFLGRKRGDDNEK